MVPPLCSFIRRLPGTTGAISLLFCGSLIAQEPAGERVSEIPGRFFQTQDSNGYFWQVSENGAVTSGETQYLQSGLNWLVGGSAFSPTRALVRSPDLYPGDAGVTLEETRGSLVLKRDLWIDRERGGVRTLDTIQNTGGQAAELEVLLRTTYPFAWQSLHGVDGELLSKDPVLTLDDRDFGLVVHFSAAEGRHDTFLLVGGGEESLRPRLSASNNRRELSLTYQMVIPAGGSQSLLHVISQQALPEIDMAAETFSRWFSRNELINPEVAAPEQVSVVNFPASAFPDESAEAGGLDTLLSLNTLLDPLGLIRRNEDTHWVSPSNRVSGTVSEATPLKIQANHLGETLLPLNRLAAIRGGSGIGRKPTFYLRNGEVRVGEVIDGSLTLTTSGEADARPLDFPSINILMLRRAADDGAKLQEGIHFVQLMDRSVITVIGDSTAIPIVTPWGNREIQLSSVIEMAHVSRPYPTHRFLTKAGSIFPGFLPDTTITLAMTSGDSLEIPAYQLDRTWRSGLKQMEMVDFGDEWLSFDEVSTGDRGGFLIRGNAFLQGSLAETTIRLVDGGTPIEIDSSSIRTIGRDLTGGAAAPMSLIIELKEGEVLRGEISDPFLSILWEGIPLDIPVESLLAFESPGSSSNE